jgi:Ring finger domain
MAIHEAKPEPGQELTRDQISALLDHGSKQTAAAVIKHSEPHLANPLITCLICIHPYHCKNVDGTIETPVMTACGHIFGNSCIEKWLKPENAYTCPLCRFILAYKACHHLIRPVPAFAPPPPPKVTSEERPLRCSNCEAFDMDRLIVETSARVDQLRAQKLDLEDEVEGLMENVLTKDGRKTLEELKVSDIEDDRELYDAVIEAKEDLEVTVTELLEAEKMLEERKNKMVEEIRKRPGWHL